MGFEINSPGNKPIIREAASMQNDGGGGNLGYFEQGEKKDKDKKNDSIFNNANESDSFLKEDELKELESDFSISKLIAQAILSIKELFKKLFNTAKKG